MTLPYVIEDCGYVTPCHVFQGATQSKGYGVVRREGKNLLAHRVSFIEAGGVIPEGKELDHLCTVKRCIRPSHLEAVTHRVNCQRAYPPICKRGHPLDGRNLHLLRDGRRRCRMCHARRERERKARNPFLTAGGRPVELGGVS